MLYAGIGSRETPQPILEQMFNIAAQKALNNWTLRSGGAPGADQAFERGCDSVNGKKEIYLPWPNFEGNKSPLFVITQEAIDMAKYYHPAPHKLTQGALKLMARNCYQVLGFDLKTPVHQIICYTGERGGTTQALRIAKDFNIPVINLFNQQ